jgi:hypothetical protein
MSPVAYSSYRGLSTGSASMGDTSLIKATTDGVLKTVGGILLFCCCGSLAWTATEIIALKGSVIEIKATANAEKAENIRVFEGQEKKFDKFETDINKKLDKLDNKLEQILNRRP